MTEENLTKVGFEPNNLTISEYVKISKSITKKRLHAAVGLIEDIRIIKTDEEITTIKKACAIGDAAFQAVLPKITKGITEKALALELEIFIKQQGAGLSFSTIVAFGANSSVPHHQTGDTKLQNNQWVLLDFGVKYNNYCSDMTRTLFFGKPTDEQKRLYKTVKTAQEQAITSCTSKKGLTGAEIDHVAREYILSQGYPSIPHGLGHGIGIEVHEQPGLHPKGKQELKPGMVFSIEPGIYQPGAGGVRIEDLTLLTKDGIEILTYSPSSFLVL